MLRSTAVLSQTCGMPGPVIVAQAVPVELFGVSPESILSDKLSAMVAAGVLARLMLAPTRVSRNGLTSLFTATAEVPLLLALRDQTAASCGLARGPAARNVLLGRSENLPSSVQSGSACVAALSV